MAPESPVDATASLEPSAPARIEPATRAAVQLRHVEVVGGDVPDATQVAQTMVPQFRECQLRWAPQAQGEVAVAAKIGPTGDVRVATPSSDNLQGMVVSCVGSQVSHAQFATPSGDDPVVVIHLRFVAL